MKSSILINQLKNDQLLASLVSLIRPPIPLSPGLFESNIRYVMFIGKYVPIALNLQKSNNVK